MSDYILISQLNDFVFCPYSIYLHNVYQGADESLFHATPQTRGRIAHESVDTKTASHRTADILSLPVYSEEFALMGKIDLYRSSEKKLIERKYRLANVYRGQIYQLWAQYFCLKEMGYPVEHLAFYEISTNRMMPIHLPTEHDKEEFRAFLQTFHAYNPADTITTNPNKCRHCIYCNLCDKTTTDNVYQ